MTRKKAKPQHRETVSTEPVNEGGFYKMLWNSMENDLGDARGDPSPVNVNLNSPPVIILSDQDSPCEENICDRLALPLPIKEENLEIQSETLQPCSENSDRSGNRVNFSSQADEGGVTVAPPQEDSSSLAESKNSLPSVPDSTPQSTKNPPIPADVLPFPNQLNVANLPISKSTEAQHEDIPAVQPSNFNVSGENGDFRSVVGQNQVCEDSNELSHTKNTSPINSKEIQSTTNAPMTRTAAENTDEALSILKSLLNQSDSDDGDVDMSLCISGNACFNSAAEALQIERLETPSSTFVTNNEENSPNCNLMSDLPAPEAMDVSIVTPTICTKPRPSNDVFPIINNFVPSKIKIEPTLVQRSLKLMKEDLAMLYNDLLSCKVIFSKAEPITYESPLSPDVELIPQSTPLPKAICLVKMERLPDPFLNNNGVVMSDKTFKTWKSQIIKQRNEERFRHLKVWRRGRTLLWRECELAGMDRATYNEQVAFIKKHKLSESSSECEASSSDESHDEASDRVSDCEAESNFSADEQTTSVATSSPASSPIRPALERRLPISPRTKPGPRKGVKYKSAAAVADQTSKSGVACRDEYVVEHTTISDCNSSESTKVSALKITLRKTSFNKSEDEQEKTADSEADSENSFTVPARPSPKKKRNFVTKRTYRKPEELSKEAGPKLLRKENKYYMEDNQDNQALLGRRSDEVENFNLLEKWDIPFEPPTLFRSPRVASRLAQQKNKETFSQKWAKKAPPKVAERVSKEVKDVVEMMCTRTVEAMLCPDLTTAMSLESKQPLIEDLKVDEASDESFNEPMPVEKPEPPKPDRCSDPEPFGEQTMPETPAEPIAEPTNPSKEQGQLDKVEHHAVVLPTKPSENPPEPAESEPPSSFDDTASELEESKLGPTQNVVISQKVKNNRRRAQGWGARKRKKRSIMAAGSVEVAASGEVEGEAPQPASPASTQVPVVSEGPGQSPLESEDDVSNSKITVDKVHDSSNSANMSDSHVKPKNKRSGQVVEKRLRSKEENLTAATQSAVEQRVTRSKQPNLGLTPEVLEKVVNRRKRSSGNSVSEDATDAGTKPRRQTRKSQRGSQVSAKQVDDAGTAANSSNTQVHEVSEGPGEIQAELGDHKAEEVITTRVLRGRSVQVNNLPAEAKYRPASCETQDRRKDAELESSKDEPKVPLIPDSPMSPTPEDNESAVENEPTLGRVTRAKKRLLREGPAFIACKQKDLENDAEEKVVDTDITKTELETKETESAVPRVLDRKEESEIQLDATEPKPAVHEDSVSLVIDFVIDQEVSAPIGRQIGTDSVDTMSDSAVQETQNFMNADLNAAVDANHTQISQPCPSPKMAVDVEPENLASDTSKDSANDLNSSSDRLAVLDVLNSIRSSIEPPKRNQKVKTPPLPTPSLPGCIDLPLESLILPDELDDFGDIGDLVVDEEFSEEENDDSPLAVRIKKIVQDQIQKKDDDDDSESIADRIKKIVQEQVEQDALSQVGGAVSKAVAEVSEKSQDGTSVAKVGDEASKQDVEAEKQGLVPSEEAKKDLKKEVSQENKENVDKSKDVPPKRRDSIDEKTGLPTSLIQRLRDPRIRSKLLSQLEEAENTAKEKTPVTVAPSDEQIEVKTSKEIQPVGALRDPRGLRSGINDPRCRDVPAVAPTVKCVAPVVPHPVTLPTVVAVRRTAGVLPVKTPVPPIPTPAPPAAPVCNSSTPLKEPSDDEEEESLKRRPKKAKKEVDAELMYKSPLEDLNSEARPSYGRAPVRRIPRRETDGRRWDVRPRRPVNLEMPRFYPWSQPQPQGEHLHPEPWKTQPWFPGFPNPYQDYTPDPQAAVLETALVNLALLPKTTNLSARALVKVYQFFNLGNPQPVNIPPPAFDPKEEARTITMSDAMGEEMIDIVQLPRPTSGLTKEFFTDLPVHHSLDDIIQKPYTTLSEVMDEEIEIQNNSGLNFLAADDDYDEALVKWPVVQKSDRNVVVVNSAVTNKTKVELDDDPLRNILHQLPLLKEQYSMNNSQLSSIKNSPISSIKNSTKSSVKDSPKSPFPGASTPPPPKWGQDVDLRTLKTSPVVKDDLEPPKDWRNPSPPKKRTSSRRRSRSPGRRRSQSRSPGRRRSQSRSPRRRSPSRSPRRRSPSRSPRRHSTSRSPRRRSKSRSPRRRRSHSRSSGSHSRSSTPASRRSRSRSPYSRRSRSRSSERRRRRLKSRSPSYKRHSTSSSPSHRRHRR